VKPSTGQAAAEAAKPIPEEPASHHLLAEQPARSPSVEPTTALAQQPADLLRADAEESVVDQPASPDEAASAPESVRPRQSWFAFVLHGLSLILLAGLAYLMWETRQRSQEFRHIGLELREIDREFREIGEQQRATIGDLNNKVNEIDETLKTSAQGQIKQSKEALDTAVAQLNTMTDPQGRFTQAISKLEQAKGDLDRLISQGPGKEQDRQERLLAESTEQIVGAWKGDDRIAKLEKTLSSFETRIDALTQQLHREARNETVVVVVFHTTKFDARRVGAALGDILARDTYRISYNNYYRLYLTLAANGRAEERLRLLDLENGRLDIKDFIFGDPDRSALEDVAQLKPGQILQLVQRTGSVTQPLFRFVIFASADAAPPQVTDRNWENIQVYAFLINEGRTTQQRADENRALWQRFCNRPLPASPANATPAVDRRGEAWRFDWPTSGENADAASSKDWQQLREELEYHLRWAIRPLRVAEPGKTDPS